MNLIHKPINFTLSNQNNLNDLYLFKFYQSANKACQLKIAVSGFICGVLYHRNNVMMEN
ncbi:hypothetical protein F543_21400 [Bibersteinia trehalosi USDA-ARS-USMARC-189]|uniref:Uncharacterized protein n=1 Tax=Bibersteinia trehalosi USDA-ARS-USMARC-189 TaxID=1263831 RepID=A0ABM5PFN5_BIBTR|nr:hypothetical protein F543_21400 [Bibersteinia trehalosi USDA-ARS-USMARC-189]